MKVLQPVGQGVPVAFYVGDPQDGIVACVAQTSMVLYAGDCETLTCDWADPPTEPADAVDVTVVVDDAGTGTGTGENSECNEGNNLATLPTVFCSSVQ